MVKLAHEETKSNSALHPSATSQDFFYSFKKFTVAPSVLTTSSLSQRRAGRISFQASVYCEFIHVPHSPLLCQPPAARGFLSDRVRSWAPPRVSSQTSTAAADVHTPQEVGHERPDSLSNVLLLCIIALFLSL